MTATSVTKYDGPPHPDYPGMVWSQPEVEGGVMAVIEAASSPEVVVASIMETLKGFGYDSMDREMAFWIATQVKGWDYEDLYDIWLES